MIIFATGVLCNSLVHCGTIFSALLFYIAPFSGCRQIITSLNCLPVMSLSFFFDFKLTESCKHSNSLFSFLSCFRYIYVPLGGSRHGPFYKMLSTGLAFGFVCLWHGGHDYLQYWALMNWAGVLVENGLKSLFASPFIHSIVVRVQSNMCPVQNTLSWFLPMTRG